MRYHDITHDDMKNGDGIRVCLFVAGCNHYCRNCQNPVTWDVNGGIPFDKSAHDEIMEQLDKPYNAGITFTGGDPLFPLNREEITALAKEIKEKYPDKAIWLYTGYLWEEIKDLPVIKYLDVIVDGPFKEDLLDVSLMWKGSSNQRVIDVKHSLEFGTVILHCGDHYGEPVEKETKYGTSCMF